MQNFGMSWLWICYILVTLIGILYAIFNIVIFHTHPMKHSLDVRENHKKTKLSNPFYNVSFFCGNVYDVDNVKGPSLYEEYKAQLAESGRRKELLFQGKVTLLAGIVFLITGFCTMPFHTQKIREIDGAQLKEGEVYHIDKIKLLDVKVDDTQKQKNKKVFCIVEIKDKNQKQWIVSFQPGTNEKLNRQITLVASIGMPMDMTINGYVYVDALPQEADTYYSLNSKRHADSNGKNIRMLNAEYLCGADENYMLEMIVRPGLTRGTIVCGSLGILYGLFTLLWEKLKRVEKKDNIL